MFNTGITQMVDDATEEHRLPLAWATAYPEHAAALVTAPFLKIPKINNPFVRFSQKATLCVQDTGLVVARVCQPQVLEKLEVFALV